MNKRFVPDTQARGLHEQGDGGLSFPDGRTENIVIEVSLLEAMFKLAYGYWLRQANR